MTDSTSIILGVAQNLAFALPPPFGPVAAAGLGAVIQGTMGGGDTAVLQDMLDDAVSEIEKNEELAALEAFKTDVQAFFQWVHDNADDADQQWTDASIDALITGPLTKVTDAVDGWGTDTFTKAVHELGDDRFIDVWSHTDRSQDAALAILYLTLTGYVAALRLQVTLAGVVVDHYSPPTVAGSRCASDDADRKVQDHLLLMRSGVTSLGKLILRPGSDPSQNNNGGFTPGQLQSFAYKPADVLAAWSLDNGQVASDSFCQVFLPDKGTPWLWANSTPQSLIENIAAFADEYGWARAVELMTMHRIAARLGFITQSEMFDFETLNNENQLGNHWGWGFKDLFLYVGSGANDGQFDWLDQNFHPLAGAFPFLDSFYGDNIAYAQTACLQERPTYVGQIYKTIYATDDPATPLGQDWKMAQDWRQGVSNLADCIGPDMPPNDIVIRSWDAADPSKTSLWNTAKLVSYAVSFVDSQGRMSPRSDWTMSSSGGEPISGSKPSLRHLPINSDPTVSTLLWRRFATEESTGGLIYSLPMIVATLTSATGDPYQDTYSAEP